MAPVKLHSSPWLYPVTYLWYDVYNMYMFNMYMWGNFYVSYFMQIEVRKPVTTRYSVFVTLIVTRYWVAVEYAAALQSSALQVSE